MSTPRSLIVLGLLFPVAAFANFGAVGYSGLQGATCSGCHGGGGVSVSFGGPTTLTAGTSGDFTLNVSANVSIDVAASIKEATLISNGAPTSVQVGELVSTTARSSGTVGFKLMAPPFSGTVKLYASASNGAGTGTAVYTVNITGGSTAPRVATAATAAANPVLGSTVAVSVVGDDDQGEANLTYTWKATGPGEVSFSPAGTNAAKNATATFSKAGKYTLTAYMKDAQGQMGTSSVDVDVSQTFTYIKITPEVAEVAPKGTEQFSALRLDQFMGAMPSATVSWNVTPGCGSISGTGLFTAQNAPSSAACAITASTGPKSAAASVSVLNNPRDLVAPKIALKSPLAGMLLTGTVNLTADATDNKKVAEVVYLLDGAPIGTVTAAPWTLAYDSRTASNGEHSMQATVKDAGGNTASSETIKISVSNEGTPGGGGDGGGDGTDGGGVKTGCTSIPGDTGLGALALLALWASRRRRDA